MTHKKKGICPHGRFVRVCLLVASLVATLSVQAQNIYTVAGTGTVGYSGDGGPATAAKIWPNGFITIDPSGNLYIPDYNMVRKVDAATGIISPFAGGEYSIAGYGGDGGPATAALLNYTWGMASDAAGNVYITDYGNSRVRKVNTSGIISTIAGNGSATYSGDGDPATTAGLATPAGVCVDASGNVYISTIGDGRVREVISGVIYTFAGNGASGFSGNGGPAASAELNRPIGICSDPSGNVYIADNNNAQVRSVTSGTINAFCGNTVSGYLGDGGLATAAEIDEATDVKADNAGNLYVTDFYEKIRVVNTAGIVSTYAGGGASLSNGVAATAASMSPNSTAIDVAGNLYIADLDNNRIRKVNAAGIITTIAGTGVAGYGGDDSAATAAKLNGPAGVAVDASGNVYIADDYNARIRKVNAAGIITTIAGTGGYGYGGDNGPATAAQLYAPHGIAVDVSGNVYICDDLNDVIRKVNSAGIITTIAGTGMPGYSGDGNAATNAQLDRPYGIALDISGNIYFTEWNNNCVRKINTAGIINTIAGGNATLGFSGDNGPATAADFHIPIGIAIDNSGNIFIGDSYNNRVRKISSSGIITTYAGIGTEGYSGDNGPAIDAELYGPVGVTVDASGNLYIADYGNGHIRFIRSTESVNTVNNVKDNISVYPNPSNGLFVVNIASNTNEKIIITITNELGEKTKEISATTNQAFEINIDVPSGIYFLTATTSSGTATKKILINKCC